MNKKLNALLQDGQIWINNEEKQDFLSLLEAQSIEYYSFTQGKESLIELMIEEEAE